MLLGCSHLTLTTEDVPRMMRFLKEAFGLEARYQVEEFGEVVLPSGFRIAVFTVVGPAQRYFSAQANRAAGAIGVTVADADAVFATVTGLADELGLRLSGPPKDHPWGERSFLLIDPDGNRWEVTKSPTPSGMLTDH